MTVVYRNGFEAAFSAWLRAHPGLDSIKERLSITDCDYWIHQFRRPVDRIGARCVDNIMLVELKTNGRSVPFAQRDTLFLLNQLRLQLHHADSGRRRHVRVRGPSGEPRQIRFFGVHTLRVEHTSPADSAWMYWDHVLIDEERLVSLLTFNHDPDNASRRLEYRRHHVASEFQQHPTLFEVVNA